MCISAFLNVSSGLAFTPMAIAPIYSATKAAVHSFTVSLRHQLEDITAIEVNEVAPTAVNNDLGGLSLKPAEEKKIKAYLRFIGDI